MISVSLFALSISMSNRNEREFCTAQYNLKSVALMLDCLFTLRNKIRNSAAVSVNCRKKILKLILDSLVKFYWTVRLFTVCEKVYSIVLNKNLLDSLFFPFP